ncbi:MAG: NADH-quinone oxidoreductase subunit NuoH [Actinomycetota bacterium]|nr:NADH-quinone oxidoreductase subunit NuoH [Actinomycetota bacterium]
MTALLATGDPLLAGEIDGGVILLVLLKTLIVFAIPLVLTALMIWVERKVHGDMSNRIGPNRAGPWGILQTLADGAKLFTKEGLIPERADRLVYRLAPYLSAVPAFLVFAVVPFGGDFNPRSDGTIDGTVTLLGNATFLQLFDAQPGILLVLVCSSVAVYGVMLAGWSSGSKYPLLGSVRATAQMVSYEAALGLSLVAVVLVSGSLSTHDIVAFQALPGRGLLPNWNLIVTGVVPFFVFFIAATAEMNRPPFDLTEAEQELVAGFNTEYSAIRFALFYIAEFMATITFGAVIATLFLGGPAGPDLGILPGWLWGTVWFFLKLAIFPFIWIWFRATLPRFRYDQLMDLGWKLMIPLSLGWILLLAAIRSADTVGTDGQRIGYLPAVYVGAGVLLAAVLLQASITVGRRRRELADLEVFD